MLLSQSLTEVPTARCLAETPIVSGEVEALYLSTPVYDSVVGSIEGLHPPCPIDRGNTPPVETNASDIAVDVDVDTPAADGR